MPAVARITHVIAVDSALVDSAVSASSGATVSLSGSGGGAIGG